MNRLCKVLIADDERPVAAGLQGQLEALGYDVVAVVDDGQRAIEVCRRTLPDVVMMDIEMPGLDGLSAARQIAQDPGTPVIILTAHGHPNLVDQAVQDGVIQYLLKPVTSPSLHAAIQTAVARAREVKSLRDSVQALELTLRERKLIERAKGILMTRRNLSEPEAFRFLQRQSQDRRMPMAKLAESVVQADELLDSPTGPTPPSSPSHHGPVPPPQHGPIPISRHSSRHSGEDL
ncbi:MAG: response regulator with putative antiterminator output domain [Planctomycetota bacterium]|nr:response regulator with putative antiterminator output domain [Planctomycetota bacterium]